MTPHSHHIQFCFWIALIRLFAVHLNSKFHISLLNVQSVIFDTSSKSRKMSWLKLIASILPSLHNLCASGYANCVLLLATSSHFCHQHGSQLHFPSLRQLPIPLVKKLYAFFFLNEVVS
uniref:U53-Liphistoxin-Lth1a_1 n=1 Tax=Liphistius thaleban TaxID=1905330 RepID=A0A4Q8K193_9ARAC